jgi:hypothetical protein
MRPDSDEEQQLNLLLLRRRRFWNPIQVPH